MSECISPFGAFDFTDFVVRATGWFPCKQLALKYENQMRAIGKRGIEIKHPYAKSPPYFIPEGQSKGNLHTQSKAKGQLSFVPNLDKIFRKKEETFLPS